MVSGEPSLLVPCLYLCQASTGWTVSAVSQKTAKNARMTHVVFWQSFSGFLPSPVCACLILFVCLFACTSFVSSIQGMASLLVSFSYMMYMQTSTFHAHPTIVLSIFLQQSLINLLNFTKYKTRSAYESLPYRHIYIGAGLHLLIKHSSRRTCT